MNASDRVVELLSIASPIPIKIKQKVKKKKTWFCRCLGFRVMMNTPRRRLMMAAAIPGNA